MSKFVLPDSGSISMSAKAADKLITRHDGMAALAYISILRSGMISADKLSAELDISVSEAEHAIYRLAEMGLIDKSENENTSAHDYKAADISKALENDEFASVRTICEEICSFPFGVEELKHLYFIYNDLALPAEVIVQMVQYFKDEVRYRYGPGRRVSMAALEKIAVQWRDEGITTLEKAEDFIRRKEHYRTTEGKIKKALEIYDRKLVGYERKYIESWISMGFDADAVRLCYERTIERLHKPNFNYMDKIFLNWHAKGLHTVDEISAGDAKPETQEIQSSGGPASKFDTDEVLRFYESMKGE